LAIPILENALKIVEKINQKLKDHPHLGQYLKSLEKSL